MRLAAVAFIGRLALNERSKAFPFTRKIPIHKLKHPNII